MADMDINKLPAEAAQIAEKISRDLGKQMRDFYDEKKHSAIQMKEEYEGMVKNRPLTSVALAFAVGFGLGFLIKRNK